MLASLRASFVVLTILVLPYQALFASEKLAASSFAATPNAKPEPRQTIPGLGTASFPTSTKSAEAQTSFLRGLLLLHLFQYADAADAFIAAERLDPDFAMAYWGEAMTFNHAVWNQLDAPAGNKALAKFAPTAEARAARMAAAPISDPRERSYIAAIELLYDGTGTKPERDARYSSAMEQLAKTYPADDDAQLFYALALIGKSEGVRDIPVYLQAASISQAVFKREPDNPGAAHYWIHGMDDPAHAAGALVAARALSKIAPDAGHAQHMCSHIFMALGMWDDVVKSNLDAIRVDNIADKAAGFPVYGCGHYPEWLEYGYLQQGRIRDAIQTLIICRRTDTDATLWIAAHPGQLPFRAKSAARLHNRLVQDAMTMRNTLAIEITDPYSGREVSRSEHVGTAVIGPKDIAMYNFVTGLTAAESGDPSTAQTQLKSVADNLEKMRADPNADPEDVKATAVTVDELTGIIHAKEHDLDSAVTSLKLASDAYEKMAFAFGPPVTVKPPEELLGEVLLEKGDAPAARIAFEMSLKLAPRRTLSLLGLARSQSAAGDKAAAKKTYTALLAIWHSADPDFPDFPGLAEAKAAIR